jgi:hypothetical protein
MRGIILAHYLVDDDGVTCPNCRVYSRLCLSVGLMTNARRAEIFPATAAYALYPCLGLNGYADFV